MYNLPQYKEPDQQKVIEFVKAHPFAFLCGCDANNKPVATQIPVFIDEKDGKLFLSGHLMKNTDHHHAFLHNPDVLAVFSGAHTYVSASWYTDKQQASTWNYMSVHAKGILKFLDDQALLDVLKRTTNYFENNPHSGSNFDDIPTEYVQRMVKAIIAFEVEVLSMDHVFKLSQNRDEESYSKIINSLQDQGGDGAIIAAEMKNNFDKVFNKSHT